MHSPLSAYLRYVNYLSAAQLYLRENFLLREPLKKEHIKERILGHWGTVPGQNFVYAHVSALIARSQQSPVVSHQLGESDSATNYQLPTTDHSWLFVSGPGHGAPGVLANLFAEGTLQKYYPELTVDAAGTADLIKRFSWPGGFPSHCNPGTPGTILEGGELGYSLSTSFGAVFDNPDLIVACVVGDGEAETGPLATSWQSIKFLNPKTSGAVLPVLHVNGYKITGPTIFGVMSDEEIASYFTGLGWEPIIMEVENSSEMPEVRNRMKIGENETFYEDCHEAMGDALDFAYGRIREIQMEWREEDDIHDLPKWPVIIMRSPKGWGGVGELKGEKVEGTQRSHGIPLQKPQTDAVEFEALKAWLESYKIGELVDADGRPLPEILDVLPSEELRMGRNRHAIGGNLRKELNLPEVRIQNSEFSGKSVTSSTAALSDYLAEVIKLNPDSFRFFCPDETESNKFSSLFKATDRAFIWPVHEWDAHNSPDGRVMEMLSEHTLQGWLQGYLLTGRHGLFVTYEAFAMITASMVDQYAKFLKQSKKHVWRTPISSLNYLLTSVGWRQEHNGYSHQNPSFIANVIEKHGELASVYFPCDANAALVIMEDCLKRTNGINVIVANKADLPQWITVEQAREELKSGIGRWDSVDPEGSENPDVVFAAAGDIFVNESIEAIRLVKKFVPNLKTRFVNVSELTALGIGDERYPLALDDERFTHYFTAEKPVIFSFHGYPSTIKSLLFNHANHARFHVHGYLEEGSTTTPFDMLVLNKTSRYHLAMEAVGEMKGQNSGVGIQGLESELEALEKYCEEMLEKHTSCIREFGKDMEEVG